MSKTAKTIKTAIKACGFLTTRGIAASMSISRTQVLEAFDEIQKSHPGKFMRIRGLEGGIGIL